MRRPSLQFYPADWQANPKLRRCSHAEKGIWLDVLCILHDQDEYGILRWPLKDIAQAVHARPTALQALVDKEVLKGIDNGDCEPFIFVPRHGRKDGEPVTLIPAQPGPIWFSSRMVRDEYVRQVRADNEPKAAPKHTFGDKSGTHPSRAGVSSSSSPSSSPSGNKETSTKDVDGETSSQNVLVEDFTIWNLGVKKLTAAGSTDKNARSFLGKQIQVYGKSEVARAVTEMLAQDAVEPTEYLVAVLQSANGTRRQRSKTDQSLAAAGRVAAKYEQQS